MTGKGKKYTVWLHPGDQEHALCIGKLDGIRDEINKRELKKGTLSKIIAKALYIYFAGQSGDSANTGISVKYVRPPVNGNLHLDPNPMSGLWKQNHCHKVNR